MITSFLFTLVQQMILLPLLLCNRRQSEELVLLFVRTHADVDASLIND